MLNGNETTVTFNADVTIVFHEDCMWEQSSCEFWKSEIKNSLDADNVIISDLKHFVNGEYVKLETTVYK